MARTIGSSVVRYKKFGDVRLAFWFHTGRVSWTPSNGASRLTKEQRQEACEWVCGEADAWGVFKKSRNPDGTHPEENLLAVWKTLFGGLPK